MALKIATFFAHVPRPTPTAHRPHPTLPVPKSCPRAPGTKLALSGTHNAFLKRETPSQRVATDPLITHSHTYNTTVCAKLPRRATRQPRLFSGLLLYGQVDNRLENKFILHAHLPRAPQCALTKTQMRRVCRQPYTVYTQCAQCTRSARSGQAAARLSSYLTI